MSDDVDRMMNDVALEFILRELIDRLQADPGVRVDLSDLQNRFTGETDDINLWRDKCLHYQKLMGEQAAEIGRANAEVERLRNALMVIVQRSKGGTGAAVCVTPQTLATIAELALGRSER